MKVIKLQSCDGELFEVDQEIVAMCTTVKNMLRGKSAFRNSLGGQFSIDGSYVILKKEGRVLASLTKNTDDEAIVALPDVKAGTLEKVIEYCKFHSNPATSEREKKAWDASFVQVKQNTLCELASASYYLDIKPLVNLTSRAIATQISGKTSEEIRETFCNINYEVYAPVFATSLATRCRLQRKFNKKKQQENFNSNSDGASKDDSRSVDELLSFIEDGPKKKVNNNNNPTPNPSKKNKKKKKKDAKSEESRNGSESPEPEDNKDNNGLGTSQDNDLSPTPSTEDEEEELESNNSAVLEQSSGMEEEEEEDVDPEMQAAVDKEVEEFRQRLESMNTNTQNSRKLQLPISAASFVSSLVGVH